MTKGQVISGEFGKIVIRQKANAKIELGELLVADTSGGEILLQAYDLVYGSQISQQNLELVSGLNLEEDTDLEFMDPKLRNYTLALLKPMLYIGEGGTKLCKTLPKFFSEVREITYEDLKFITKPKNPLFLGKLRSGSKLMDVDIALDGEKVFSHHILIPGTTGRGKSVLLKIMLWNQVEHDYCGVLVLDPHDEYYGRNNVGLKDHTKKENVVFYTPKNAPAGAKTLKININAIKPWHFNGVMSWTDAQNEALSGYYRKFGENWIEAVLMDEEVEGFQEATVNVLKRRLISLLNLTARDGQIYSNGIFDTVAGLTTVNDIVNELEQSKTVIVDTSSFAGNVEILIGSLVASEVFRRYKSYKMDGQLKSKPVISIVLEEAPRVLGKEVLERGSNIFSTIAREGRKFKVGLTAITQLPSLIPRTILANMNTKIILGIEMAPERQAIIESASQDLSTDNRNIASLDKGEAIVTSNFARFAIPIKIPFFDEMVSEKPKTNYTQEYSGIKMR